MNDMLLMVCFVVASLASLAFLLSRYRTATVPQRRQILWGTTGALLVVGGTCCAWALSGMSR